MNEVYIKLDGNLVSYRDIEIKPARKISSFSYRPLEVKLTLLDGRVIYDDGSRVELVFADDCYPTSISVISGPMLRSAVEENHKLIKNSNTYK